MTNFNRLILATFLSTTMFMIGNPTINVRVMQGLDTNTVALGTIIICVGGSLAGAAWNRWGKALYPYWGLLSTLEALMFGVINTYYYVSNDAISYYIVAALVNGFIVRNLVCGGNRLRSLLFEGELREKYDNTNMMAMSVATVVGSVINIVLEPTLQYALIIEFIGDVIDNILYYSAWKSTLKQ